MAEDEGAARDASEARDMKVLQERRTRAPCMPEPRTRVRLAGRQRTRTMSHSLLMWPFHDSLFQLLYEIFFNIFCFFMLTNKCN